MAVGNNTFAVGRGEQAREKALGKSGQPGPGRHAVAPQLYEGCEYCGRGFLDHLH